MRIFFVLLLSLFLYNCKSAKKENLCKNYRDGKYIIHFKTGGTEFEIERKDSMQAEYNIKTDTIAGYDVRWTDSCEYVLTRTYRKKKTVSDTSGKQTLFETGKPLRYKVRIITGNNDYYIYEIQTIGLPALYSDTAWIKK
jgi:hypothetical protein